MFTDISVKTINNETYAYTVSPTTTVCELKSLLRGSTTIEVSRQRLIFRGRVLQDDLPLRDYSISSGHVLHMVARPITDVEPSSEANRSVAQPSSSSTLSSPVYRFPQLPSQNLGESETIPSTQTGQLLSLTRHELELLNHLMSGDSQVRQESNFISQIQQQQSQQQRQQQPPQLYTSDISSFSFQPSSRFSLPVSAATNVSSAAPSAAPSRNNLNTSSDAVERIRQGLLTMETILSTMNDFHSPPAFITSITPTDSAPLTNVTNSNFRSIFNVLPSDNVMTESISETDGNSVTSSTSSDSEVGSKRKCTESHDSRPNTGSSSNNLGITNHESGNIGMSRVGNTFVALESAGEALKSTVERTFVPTSTSASSSASSSASVPLPIDGTDGQDRTPGLRLQSEVRTRRFYVGQWIDVKDTVSQWLEATIILVDQERQRIFVHYNGW